MDVIVCARLTSFEELGVQVRQATGDGVRQSAAADPVVGLDAQVAAQRTLMTADKNRSDQVKCPFNKRSHDSPST